MSDSDERSAYADGPAAEADEERLAFFDELMREEWRKNAPPVSGLAVATLIMSFVGWAGGLLSWVVGLFWMACALVFAVGAVSQIRHRDRRGIVFVVLGVVVIAVWAVYVTVEFPPN
jgi:hypothetical protein